MRGRTSTEAPNRAKNNRFGGMMVTNHAMQGMWEVEGLSNAAASSYRWFRDVIATAEKQRAEKTGTTAYELLNELAASAEPGSRGLLYLPYLALEIVKANLDVARRILDPKLPIDPVLVRVKTSQASELGQVLYANSITLTPGTVSMQVDGGGILVHAIAREMAEDLEGGEMDRRVTAVERGGGRRPIPGAGGEAA